MSATNLNSHCVNFQQVLRQEDKLKDFYALTDDASRIKFLFGLVDFNKFVRLESLGKNFRHAENLRNEGDSLLEDDKPMEALDFYNDAIKLCPQRIAEEKRAYLELIEKRSEIFRVRKEFTKELQDLQFIEDLSKNCPDFNTTNIKLRLEDVQESKGVESETIKDISCATSNAHYPAFSNKVMVKKDDEQGRYLIATSDIKTGEVLGVETPYASVVYDKTMCSLCSCSTNQIYACADCQEIYCSSICMKKARNYHRYECNNHFRPESEWVALRMITQRPLDDVIAEEMTANAAGGMEVYKGDDYYNASRLIVHEDKEPEVVLSNVFKAVVWLKLLSETGYFGCKGSSGSGLTGEELLVGELLLRYLQIYKFNSHTIDGKDFGGVGIYPTLSLINHSCDPSLTGYHIGKKLILLSRKPVKRGEMVFVSYTAPYTFQSRSDRHKITSDYRFTCACQACAEDWPLLDYMDAESYRSACDCGYVITWSRHTLVQKCQNEKCGKRNNFREKYHAIQNLDTLIISFNENRKKGDFAKATTLCAEIIDQLFGICVAPCHILGEFQTMFDKCVSQLNKTCAAL